MSASAIRHPLPSLLLATLIAGCTVSPLKVDKEWGTTGTGGANTSSTADNGGSSSEDSSSTSAGGTKASFTTKSAGGTASIGGTKSTGGTTGAGGTKSTGGTTGHGGSQNTGGTSTVGTTAPPPACLGNPLPMPANGFVAANSNGCGITGTWYWFKDTPAAGVTLETKVTTPATTVTPVVAAGGEACLAGSTVVDSSFKAWGAGVGLDLNGLNGTPRSYDATAHGIGGFEVTLTGSFPQGLRVQFGTLGGGALPFVLIPGPGTYRVRFADAFVPNGWMDVVNRGKGIDPTAVTSFQAQVIGGDKAGNFSFCVKSVIPLPIDDDGAMGTKPVTFVNLPIDSSGAVTQASNALGIQGSYYCALPATASSFTCGVSTSSTVNPYSAALNGLYVAGKMTTNSLDWGGKVGLTLNSPVGGTMNPFDGTTAKLRGFRINTTGSTANLPLRISTSSVPDLSSTVVSPIYEFAQPGQHLIELGTIACQGWPGVTCNAVDPGKLYFLEIELSTMLTAMDYELTVTKLEAMIAR